MWNSAHYALSKRTSCAEHTHPSARQMSETSLLFSLMRHNIRSISASYLGHEYRHRNVVKFSERTSVLHWCFRPEPVHICLIPIQPLLPFSYSTISRHLSRNITDIWLTLTMKRMRGDGRGHVALPRLFMLPPFHFSTPPPPDETWKSKLRNALRITNPVGILQLGKSCYALTALQCSAKR